MAGVYNDLIQRQADANLDPLEIPQEVSRVILQNAVQSSTVLQLAQTRRMPSRSYRMPAIDMFPSAYWLAGGSIAAKASAYKQTTELAWKNITMAAEEVAVMVPIPDAYVADTGMDLFGEVAPRIGEQIGYKLDSAALFNNDNPWSGTDSEGIYQRALSFGNTVSRSTPEGNTTTSPSPDFAALIAQLNLQIARQGFSVNGYAASPGFPWFLAQARTSTGVSPYAPVSGVDTKVATLFGRPFHEVLNNSWDIDRADVICGDWTKALVGIRQDVTMTMSNSAIITDPSTGDVVYNAFQQDGKVLRVVARYAFCTMSYKTVLSQSTEGYAFGVIRPQGAPSS